MNKLENWNKMTKSNNVVAHAMYQLDALVDVLDGDLRITDLQLANEFNEEIEQLLKLRKKLENKIKGE